MLANSFSRRCLVFSATLAALGRLAAAEPRIELEVVTAENLIGGDARSWNELLGQAGFTGVRIRSASGGETPAIKGGAAGSFRVTGILTSSNQLVLPKGRFGLNDRSALSEWVRKLREGGEDAIMIKPLAYGLLPNEVQRVERALAVPLADATLGKPPREVAKRIAEQLPYKFIADTTSQQALNANEPVADELQGLSSGTALAALLRPLGLALVPEKHMADIRLRIVSASSAKEFWPVGWPPKDNPSQTLPELFKFLTVEIEATPLNEAMAAIGSRVNAPLLLDHNALAREKVDLAMKVSFPRASTFYGRALDRLLFQARLKFEIRVDEANKPFLWVTTLKQ